MKTIYFKIFTITFLIRLDFGIELLSVAKKVSMDNNDETQQVHRVFIWQKCRRNGD